MRYAGHELQLTVSRFVECFEYFNDADPNALEARFGSVKAASSMKDRLAPGGASSLRWWFACGGGAQIKK